jgi:prepilin-type N-terminal cleavage/methylation domain-containing protein
VQRTCAWSFGPVGARAGFSLAELLVVLLITSVLLLLAAPRMARVLDGFAVRAASGELVVVFASARQAAIAQRGRVAVVIDSAAGMVRVTDGDQLFLERPLRALYGVSLSATRDSMAYDARGLGYGAANLSVVARRGPVAETLYVSRLGRVRR